MKEVISQHAEIQVDLLFESVCEEFDLKYGDITPNQMNKLNQIQDDLIDILVEFVTQNKD
tara:strand:- start:1504 stop:1683 length:180 start_codon:yes stop_codon:yes gene_type:complete